MIIDGRLKPYSYPITVGSTASIAWSVNWIEKNTTYYEV